MKLNEQMRFAHPVLSPYSNDFPEAAINCEMSVHEVVDLGQVVIKGTTEIGQADIEAAIGVGTITSGVFVVCLDTYFQRFYPTTIGEWEVELPPGAVRGAVSVRPVAFVARGDVSLPKAAVHAEFAGDSLLLRSGDLVALADEQRFEAGLDKLVPMESVFRLLPNPDLDDPRFELLTDKQAVEIHVSPKLYDQIAILRAMPGARNLLLSSLYLPCIVELLSIASEEERSDLRWYQAIASRCRQLGLDLDKRDLSRKAQQLLGYPLGLLHDAVEGLSK